VEHAARGRVDVPAAAHAHHRRRRQQHGAAPRPVDVAVTRPIGEGLAGKDTQIEAAAKELLAQIDKRSTQN